MIKKIVYGGVGLTATMVIVGFLLADKPNAYTPTTLAENVISDSLHDDLDIDPRDYEFDGDFEMPVLFDTYHLSESELEELIGKAVVTLGRDNPMLFGSNEPVDYSSGASYTWQDIMNNTEVEEGQTLGYDVNANSQGGGEIKPVEIASIEEKFAYYAVYPVDKKYYNFTSQYGPRIDPIHKDKEVFHGGIDISQVGIDGKNIYSVLPGAVSHIDYNPKGYGHFIVINHGDFTTLYAHLKEAPTLSVGDKVKAGDVIGIIGTTGRSTGPHLHFEVAKDSVLIDPRPLLDSIGTGDPADLQLRDVEEETLEETVEGDE